jgi:hypothetical protein
MINIPSGIIGILPLSSAYTLKIKGYYVTIILDENSPYQKYSMKETKELCKEEEKGTEKIKQTT